jgi:hypothetical protein
LNESEKILTQTRLGESRRQVTELGGGGGGEGSRAELLRNASILRIDYISLGKPKSLQVEEDKSLAEDMVFVIYRIMSLTGKYIGGGIGSPQNSKGEELEKAKLSLVQKVQDQEC